MFQLLALAAAVMAFVALVRTRRTAALGEKVEALEREVASLRAVGPSLGSAMPTMASDPVAASEVSVESPDTGSSGRPDDTSAAPRSGSQPAASASPPRRRGPIAPPPASAPPSGPRFQLPAIDWEHWIGVRGAAVLGGVVLAIAGVYFFQYSIEHGLIPPWLRVVSGTVFGVACLSGAELWARKRYAVVANPLVGGGIAVLYAAFWAARGLYGLVDASTAFVLMVSVTGACTVLAHRHASLVIALIGLTGGFATPALLSSGSDRPIALFAYILLLDASLLFVARRRGWPVLALLSLVGTLGYQAVWIIDRMQPDQLLIALVVLAVFAFAYGYAMRSVPAEGRRQWLLTQAIATLFPFFFALWLAAQGRLAEHIYPIGLLLVLLSASASWIGRVQGRSWLGLGAAAASLGTLAVQIATRQLDTALAFEAAGLCVLIAGVFHVFVELDRDSRGRAGPAPAAMVSSLGGLALLIVCAATGRDIALWPWLAGWIGLAMLALRHGGFAGRGLLQPVAAVAVVAGIWVFGASHGTSPHGLGFPGESALVLVLAVALQAVAMLRRNSISRVWGERAAAAFVCAALFTLLGDPRFADSRAVLGLGTATLYGLLGLLAATRMPSGAWTAAVAAFTVLAHSSWTTAGPALAEDPEVVPALLLQLATTLLLSFWPFVAFARLRGDRFAWYAAALAGPALFLSQKALFEAAFGPAAIGLLPIGLGAVSLGCAALASRMREVDDPRRTSNLAWFLAAALGFVTVAVPLQLEKEWITLGWALEGLAAIWLWHRLDHVGLKYFGLALLAGVILRLVGNEAVLGYYPRPNLRILNWLLYTYLVPAGALLAASRILLANELDRVREFERPLYRFGQPVASAAAGVGAIVVVFVWINLAIADWFATGSTLSISLERAPARDLATSIAWAIYAVTLLALGVRGESRGLRWLSLGLTLLATGKVFLHDLGELDDLYRVASLLGLATSLIGISLAYQRFVFRQPIQEHT